MRIAIVNSLLEKVVEHIIDLLLAVVGCMPILMQQHALEDRHVNLHLFAVFVKCCCQGFFKVFVEELFHLITVLLSNQDIDSICEGNQSILDIELAKFFVFRG